MRYKIRRYWIGSFQIVSDTIYFVLCNFIQKTTFHPWHITHFCLAEKKTFKKSVFVVKLVLRVSPYNCKGFDTQMWKKTKRNQKLECTKCKEFDHFLNPSIVWACFKWPYSKLGYWWENNIEQGSTHNQPKNVSKPNCL